MQVSSQQDDYRCACRARIFSTVAASSSKRGDARLPLSRGHAISDRFEERCGRLLPVPAATHTGVGGSRLDKFTINFDAFFME